MANLADGPYQPQAIEDDILAYWLEQRLYKPETADSIFRKQSWRVRTGTHADKFTIINPPPNAYARPHMGNVSGYAYQDLFGRRARMQGKTTLLLPGKDHAAQQAEIVYIKEVLLPKGQKKEDFTREEFYQNAYDYFTGIMKIAQADEKRIGLSADFDRDLFTLDPRVAATVYRTFAKMWNENMVYKGVRLVNWSPGLNSAVADIDTERKTVQSKMYYLKYALPGTAQEVETFESNHKKKNSVEATILGESLSKTIYQAITAEGVNVYFSSSSEIGADTKVTIELDGIAVFSAGPLGLIGRHADQKPLSTEVNDKRFNALFKALNNVKLGLASAFIKLFSEATNPEYKETTYARGFIIGTVRPETKFGDTAIAANPNDARYKDYLETELELLSLNGPVKIRFIADPAVDQEFGTGLLKITPAHSATDYEIYLRYNASHLENPIGYKNVIGKDSRLNHIAGLARNLHAETDREQIADLFREHGLIVYDEPSESNITICERTKTTIQPIMSSQWFVDTDKLKLPALEAVRSGTIKIHPDYMTKKLEIWLENLRDWPISRSIWWGYQIPVYYKGELTEVTDELGQLVVQVGEQGIADMADGIDKGLIKLKLANDFAPILIPGLGSPENSTVYRDLKVKYPWAQIVEIPNINNPKYSDYASAFGKLVLNQDSIVIAHSLGCPAILNYLTANKLKIKHLILVAPSTEQSAKYEQWIETGFWENKSTWKTANLAKELALIYSDNDETQAGGVSAFTEFAQLLNGPRLSQENAKQHFWTYKYSHESKELTRILAQAAETAAKVQKQELQEMSAAGWQQDGDVFDTWFSSGQWPYATLQAEGLMNYYPTAVMETGFDILELWVSRMIMLGVYTQDAIPFENVYLHGLIKAEDGQKMSKSKGNIVYTSDIIAEYGADALRMMYIVGNRAGASYRADAKKLKGYRNFLNKIWNASKFIFTNFNNELTPEVQGRINIQLQKLEELKFQVTDSGQELKFNLAELKNIPKVEIVEKLAGIDIEQLLIKNLAELVANVDNHMDNFRPGMAAEEIYLNFWQLFADIYVEQVKSRLFLFDREDQPINRAPEQIASREKALTHLLFALKTYLKLLHPFTPFITEHIWQTLPLEMRESETILYSQWPLR